jgi:hypothetical protein
LKEERGKNISRGIDIPLFLCYDTNKSMKDFS